MTYNVLDLPLSYTKGNTQVEWKYSAEGVKLQEKTTVTAGGQSSVTTVDHVGDFVLTDGALTRVDFAGGFADMTGSSPAFFHFLTDHLGSVRVVADAQGNVHQANHYYPYGDRFTDPRYTVSSSGAGSDNGRLFAGKEQERTSGLYDFEARFGNTFLGRFTTMDPMAEKYYSISPYAYCAGDPVNLIDKDGKEVWVVYNREKNRLLLIDADHYANGLPTKFVSAKDYQLGGIRDKDGHLTHNQVLVIDNVFSGGEVDDGMIVRDPSKPLEKAIPIGTYDIVDNDADTDHNGWYRLDRQDNRRYNDKDDVSSRSGFRFHLGSISYGCVTVDKTQSDAELIWSVVTSIMSSTSTTEVPEKRGKQWMNPFSRLKKYGKMNVTGSDRTPNKTMPQNE